MKPERHLKLAHLSEQQLAALIARYYEGSKTSELVDEFGIDARPSDLFEFFPPQMVTGLQCPYCELDLWQKLHSRSSRWEPQPYCPGCGHEHTEGTYRHCHCSGCRKRVAEVDAEIEAKKRLLVEQWYPPAKQWDNPDIQNLVGQLTLRDAVFVMALYRNADVDDEGTAGAPYAKERPLAPTTPLITDVLGHLVQRGLVRVSATSTLESFQFDDQLTRVEAHYIFKVRYGSFLCSPSN